MEVKNNLPKKCAFENQNIDHLKNCTYSIIAITIGMHSFGI